MSVNFCPSCRRDNVLFDHWEDDICVDCLEIEIERSRQRKEWNMFHDEPCPENELTPRISARN